MKYLRDLLEELDNEIEEDSSEFNDIDQKACDSIASKEQNIEEAEYQGRQVPLGKPMKGDVKKYKVYVKNDQGNVVKVNFGAPGMEIKRDDPERRKSFRARHRCDDPGPRTSARYWSCQMWQAKKSVTDMLNK